MALNLASLWNRGLKQFRNRLLFRTVSSPHCTKVTVHFQCIPSPYACHRRTVERFPTKSYHLSTVERARNGVVLHSPRQVNGGVDDRKWDLSPGAMPCWWVLMRTKQLSMTATDGLMWLCHTAEVVRVLQCGKLVSSCEKPCSRVLFPENEIIVLKKSGKSLQFCIQRSVQTLKVSAIRNSNVF